VQQSNTEHMQTYPVLWISWIVMAFI